MKGKKLLTFGRLKIGKEEKVNILFLFKVTLIISFLVILIKLHLVDCGKN